jgi:hypothetical protein
MLGAVVPMRKLTFKGFLASYVKELSHSGTVDVSALAKEATKDNFRLRAPLVLYAVVHGKSGLLRRELISNVCKEALLQTLDILDQSNVEMMLEQGNLPEEYVKVWNSFKVRRDRPQNDEALKAAMRTKIIQLQKDKNCSNYRLYKDLKLNPGNVNSWLKHGDGSKVSYQTAQQIITYVMQY